ncbi:WD40 repeat domain-containing protein, partial [Nostoc sp. PCC 9305]|uniref:WD40 repeat domain-containing protein n=1 Tax=Nostoc sp. PCC 9305 TaxID=296636 RepID=UPI0039C6D554
TLNGHLSYVNAIALSSDSEYVVSGSGDKKIKIWEFTTGNIIIRTIIGHSASINVVTLSSDGKYVVSGSNDKTVKIWEFATRKEIATFTSEGSICCCGITSDGTTIIAGDVLGNLHFLRLENIEVLS